MPLVWYHRTLERNSRHSCVTSSCTSMGCRPCATGSTRGSPTLVPVPGGATNLVACALPTTSYMFGIVDCVRKHMAKNSRLMVFAQLMGLAPKRAYLSSVADVVLHLVKMCFAKFSAATFRVKKCVPRPVHRYLVNGSLTRLRVCLLVRVCVAQDRAMLGTAARHDRCCRTGVPCDFGS